jgi:broad specificity phosphatase PhoE
MTRILLARHGETMWNREGRWQGHADIELDPAGRRQARALGARLAGEGIDALYTSDLARAMETAAAIAAVTGVEAAVDPDLREVDVGDWSGLTRADVRARDPQWHAAWERGEAPAYPGGETYAQLYARATAAFGRIVAAHPGGATVVVVCHGGTIRAIVSEVVGLGPRDRWRIATGQNCSVTRIEADAGRTALVTLNEPNGLQ